MEEWIRPSKRVSKKRRGFIWAMPAIPSVYVIYFIINYCLKRNNKKPTTTKKTHKIVNIQFDSFHHESCALCYGVLGILPLLAVQHLGCTDLELRLS